MSLNYDLTAIPEENRTIVAEADDPNGEYKAGDRILSPVTHSLLWATLGIGMGEITAENVHEFYSRLRIQEALNGTYLKKAVEGGGFEDRLITLDEVKAHIGLKTNVFPKRSNSLFMRQVISEVVRDGGGDVTAFIRGWKDDYQEVVQWGRGLIYAYDDNAGVREQRKFVNGLARALPPSDTYPFIDPDTGKAEQDEYDAA